MKYCLRLAIQLVLDKLRDKIVGMIKTIESWLTIAKVAVKNTPASAPYTGEKWQYVLAWEVVVSLVLWAFSDVLGYCFLEQELPVRIMK